MDGPARMDGSATIGDVKISVRGWRGDSVVTVVTLDAPTFCVTFETTLSCYGGRCVLYELAAIQKHRRAAGVCDSVLGVERAPDVAELLGGAGPKVYTDVYARRTGIFPVLDGGGSHRRQDVIAYDSNERRLFFAVRKSDVLEGDELSEWCNAWVSFDERSGLIFPILDLLANAAFSHEWPDAPIPRPMIGSIRGDDASRGDRLRWSHDNPCEVRHAPNWRHRPIFVTLANIAPGVSFRTVGYHVGRPYRPTPRYACVHAEEQKRRDRDRAQAATWLKTGRSLSGAIDARRTGPGGGPLARERGRLWLKTPQTSQMRDAVRLDISLVDGSPVWRAFVSAYMSVIDAVTRSLV